jgi:hypothetical protein
VLGIDTLFQRFILLSETLSFVYHLFDLFFAETTAVIGDRNDLLLADSLLMGSHSHDAVLIDLEGDLNLWDTTSRWWDS